VELKFFLTGPNTLAYFAGASLAKKKRFMTLTQNIFFDAKKKEIEFDYATFLQRSKQFQRPKFINLFFQLVIFKYFVTSWSFFHRQICLPSSNNYRLGAPRHSA
jgi:hypothetical protein